MPTLGNAQRGTKQLGDSTWGDRCCDGGKHGHRGPKEEAPNPGVARQAGDEGKFPGRSDWSLTKQVKWGGKEGGASGTRQEAQQVQTQRPALCDFLWLAWVRVGGGGRGLGREKS